MRGANTIEIATSLVNPYNSRRKQPSRFSCRRLATVDIRELWLVGPWTFAGVLDMRMGHYVVGAAAILVVSVCCQADESEQPIPTSDRPAECPDGHKQLRDVPIRYGLVSNDEQLQRDLADLKYVLGGCIVGKDSPKTTVICSKCRFRYNGDGVWHKSSTNADLFGKPFSKVLLDFLQLFKPEDAVHYDQTVEGTRLISQRIQFKCTEDRKTLDVEVTRLLQRHGIRRDASRYDHEVFYGTDAQSSVYQVWVLTDQGNQLLDLSISSEQT